MKILNSFDTKFDENSFKFYQERFNGKNVFMIKRDRIFLLGVIFYLFILLLVFTILLVIVYYQYDNNLYKYLMIFLYLFGIGLWLFYVIKLIINYFKKRTTSIIKTLSEEDFKDGEYERFLKHSIFIFIFQFFVLILSLILTLINLKSGFNEYMLAFIQIILNILFLYLLVKTFKVILDFENDFAIVTPEKIEFVNQKGIFSRVIESIDAEKIKSIFVNKKGLLRSFFNVGSITIFTEGDEASKEGNRGQITLKWIGQPEKIHKEIEKVIYGK